MKFAEPERPESYRVGDCLQWQQGGSIVTAVVTGIHPAFLTLQSSSGGCFTRSLASLAANPPILILTARSA